MGPTPAEGRPLDEAKRGGGFAPYSSAEGARRREIVKLARIRDPGETNRSALSGGQDFHSILKDSVGRRLGETSASRSMRIQSRMASLNSSAENGRKNSTANPPGKDRTICARVIPTVTGVPIGKSAGTVKAAPEIET